MSRTRNSTLFLSAAIFLLFAGVHSVLAASISITPASGNYTVGRNFTVSIEVSSPDQAMNAVQGVLLYPQSQLSVVSISKGGSIVSLWVQEPAFNNSTGKVNFEGVVLNPGFTGSGGRVLQVTFRPKVEGAATLSFSGASVLANDGSGTNILSQVGTGKYLIEADVIASRLPVPDVTFTITQLDNGDAPNPAIKLEVKNFNTPIDHYEIRVDQKDFVSWNDDGTHIYQLPVLAPGKHVVNGRAYYADGKFLEASKEIAISSLPKPQITNYPKVLNAGETLVVHGKTLPKVKVIMFVQRDVASALSYELISEESGEFVFVYDESVAAGVYKFWAGIEDERGAQSGLTEKYSVAVREAAIIRIGSWLINIATLLAALIGLIAICLLIVFYVWYRLRILRHRLTKEINKSEAGIHRAFRALKDDVEEQLLKIERAGSKRNLTAEEKEISRVLIAHLDVAEEFLEKEMRAMKDEVSGEHSHKPKDADTKE